MDWLFTESWVEATRVVASHVTAAKESRGLDWMVGAGFGKSRYGSRGEDWSGEEWIGKARIGLARLVTAAMLCSGMERRGLVRRAWQAKARTGSDRQSRTGVEWKVADRQVREWSVKACCGSLGWVVLGQDSLVPMWIGESGNCSLGVGHKTYSFFPNSLRC